jgi:hypothetical protein
LVTTPEPTVHAHNDVWPLPWSITTCQYRCIGAESIATSQPCTGPYEGQHGFRSQGRATRGGGRAGLSSSRAQHTVTPASNSSIQDMSVVMLALPEPADKLHAVDTVPVTTVEGGDLAFTATPDPAAAQTGECTSLVTVASGVTKPAASPRSDAFHPAVEASPEAAGGEHMASSACAPGANGSQNERLQNPLQHASTVLLAVSRRGGFVDILGWALPHSASSTNKSVGGHSVKSERAEGLPLHESETTAAEQRGRCMEFQEHRFSDGVITASEAATPESPVDGGMKEKESMPGRLDVTPANEQGLSSDCAWAVPGLIEGGPHEQPPKWLHALPSAKPPSSVNKLDRQNIWMPLCWLPHASEERPSQSAVLLCGSYGGSLTAWHVQLGPALLQRLTPHRPSQYSTPPAAASPVNPDLVAKLTSPQLPPASSLWRTGAAFPTSRSSTARETLLESPPPMTGCSASQANSGQWRRNTRPRLNSATTWRSLASTSVSSAAILAAQYSLTGRGGHTRMLFSLNACPRSLPHAGDTTAGSVELWSTSLDRKVIAWQLESALEDLRDWNGAGSMSMRPVSSWLCTGAPVTALHIDQVLFLI